MVGTGIHTFCNLLRATNEGISLVVLVTTAVSGVSDDRTTGIVSTYVGTRILALFVDAGLVRWALTAQRALRSAIRWAADIVGHTGADWSVLFNLANGVGSARRWHARVLWHRDVATWILNG